jgi:predicted amidohydrolase
MACRLLSQAGERGCDIACYPEDVQGIAHYGYYLDDSGLFTDFVETVPGPATERIAEVAKRRRMNVVFGVYERVDDAIRNAAVLMGRDGEIIGKYHKVHLPAVESWSVQRGDGFPVFEADFGTVGMLICYDLMFPEATRALVLNGAEILFNPTMAYHVPYQCESNGLMRVQMRAIDNFVPVAVSLCGGGSVIVDSDGRVLAHARPEKEEIIAATIDLDGTPVDRTHWDVLSGTADVKARFLQERVPDAYGDLTAARPCVLERYHAKGKSILSTPDEFRAAYEEIHRRWSPRT